MADKFSAAWWNEQAIAAGGLDKSAVESLTGMAFPVEWAPDGSIPWDKAWPKQALLRAPGLEGSGLHLQPATMPGGYPYRDAAAAFAANDPNWGGWARLVSQVGYEAPGANAAWTPVLSPTYVPPPPAVESPEGTAVSAPSDDGPRQTAPVGMPVPVSTGLLAPRPTTSLAIAPAPAIADRTLGEIVRDVPKWVWALIAVVVLAVIARRGAR
jgi:hypothetical protein